MQHALAYEKDKFSHLNPVAKIEYLKSSLKTWTTRKELHMGLKQKEKKLYPLEFPEELLIILFIHRYAITDERSLNNLKRLASSDFIPFQEQVEPNFQLYDPSWLGRHVVVNIVEISSNTISFGPAIANKVLNTPKNTNTRLKMAIYHTTTKAFIQILLKYGGHPKLPKGLHFDRFQQLLNKRATNDQPTTVTELIFDALPFIFKHYMGSAAGINRMIRGLPNKATCQSDKWLPSVTLDQFNLLVPAQLREGESLVNTGLSIFNYFEKIFDGTASYDDVLTFAPILETTTEKKGKTPEKKGKTPGGGGGGGGGSGTPRKKAQINVEQIQRCLSTIDSSVQGIRQGLPDAHKTDELLTSITGATTEIRNLVSPQTAQQETTSTEND